MTDTDRSDDPWSVADDIDDMVESWDPDAVEQPRVDDDYVNKRMLALRFLLDEQQRIRTMYDDQISVLETEIERLRQRCADQLEPEQDRVDMLTFQLRRYHAAQLADAERRRVRRLPTMLRMPHGDLRSKAPGLPTVDYDSGHADEIVEWLIESGYSNAVRHIDPVPARTVPDKAKLRKLIKIGDDGEIIGIVNTDGEPMPHARYDRAEHSFWIELADGRSSKDWQQ